MIKTTDDLMRAVLRILPDATFETDNEGQLVIYTNKQEKNGVLVDFESNID